MAKIVLVETAKIVPGDKPRGQLPQGLLLIGNALKKAGHNVDIVDAFIEDSFNKTPIKIKSGTVHKFGLPNNKLVSLVLSKKPDIVGITYMLTTEHGIKTDFVTRLKKKAPFISIIIGGTAASCNAPEILGDGLLNEKINGVDIVIKGRGVGLAEKTTVKLVDLLIKKGKFSKAEYFRKLKQLEGVAYFDELKKRIVNTPYPLLNLKDYPYSYDRSFLKKALNKKFSDRYGELNNPHAGSSPYPPQTEVTTSNGCPFSCEFCHIISFKQELKKTWLIKNIKQGKIWDRLPLKVVYKEISKIKKEGYKTISFEDDNFFGYLSTHLNDGIKILSFCHDIGFKCIQFPNGLTISSLLKINARALHKLGKIARSGIIIRFAIPIESGSDDTLKNYIKKPHTKEMVIRLLDIMKKFNYLSLSTFQPEAFFVFGAVDSKGNIEPMKNIYESRNFLLFVAKEYNIPLSLFGCTPSPPNIHYQKYIQQIESKGGKVNWPELLFTQVVSLAGQEKKASAINRILQETRKKLKKENLLHARSAT